MVADHVIDFGDQRDKNRLWDSLKRLSGLNRITIRPYRENRTTQQNRYYWSCMIPAAVKGLEDAWGESLSPEACHEFLKNRFLSRPIVNRATGEVVGQTVESSAFLDTQQFSQYLDQVRLFLAEYLHVEAPAP